MGETVSTCFDCGKVNVDEAFEEIKQQAKQAAVAEGEGKAVYKEAGEWKILPAQFAIDNGINFTTILSPYY